MREIFGGGMKFASKYLEIRCRFTSLVEYEMKQKMKQKEAKSIKNILIFRAYSSAVILTYFLTGVNSWLQN